MAPTCCPHPPLATRRGTVCSGRSRRLPCSGWRALAFSTRCRPSRPLRTSIRSRLSRTLPPRAVACARVPVLSCTRCARGRSQPRKQKKNPPSNKEPSPLHRYAWAFAAAYTLHPERAHVSHQQGRARLMCVCGVFAFHFRFTIPRRRTRRGSHFPSLTT